MLHTDSKKAAREMILSPFGYARQVIAAFTIFILEYVELFVSLMICLFVCLAVAKGIYEGAKKVRTYAMKSASAKTFLLSNVALISGTD
jgi:hypothetical protein